MQQNTKPPPYDNETLAVWNLRTRRVKKGLGPSQDAKTINIPTRNRHPQVRKVQQAPISSPIGVAFFSRSGPYRPRAEGAEDANESNEDRGVEKVLVIGLELLLLQGE
ncbi:hypothetical protein VTJ04DRAFT_101 [Mycothermus thermophilus]|uniref:uncharacterized protein n=1 Tax=Humicola insolens TaxID=85995 RepID=UPI0037428800